LLRPDFIIGCNWITDAQKMCYEYSRKSNCRFLVMQHGSYVGGIVTVDNHKYVQCDKFLVWGEYFKEMFDAYNQSRTKDILVFGNPIYNSLPRSTFQFPRRIEKILVALSFMDDEKLISYEEIFNLVRQKYPDVCVKYHNHQKRKFRCAGICEIKGSFGSIVNDFDLLIVDHSTVLLDAVFFKKNVVFVKHPDLEKTIYDQFLKNRFNTLKSGSFSFEELIDQPAQEKLFQYMVTLKDNDLETLLN
jgi:hypothetical protein